MRLTICRRDYRNGERHCVVLWSLGDLRMSTAILSCIPLSLLSSLEIRSDSERATATEIRFCKVLA